MQQRLVFAAISVLAHSPTAQADASDRLLVDPATECERLDAKFAKKKDDGEVTFQKKRDDDPLMMLHLAVNKGKYEQVKRVLKCHKNAIKRDDATNLDRTALCRAVTKNDYNMVKLLLKYVPAAKMTGYVDTECGPEGDRETAYDNAERTDKGMIRIFLEAKTRVIFKSRQLNQTYQRLLDIVVDQKPVSQIKNELLNTSKFTDVRKLVNMPLLYLAVYERQVDVVAKLIKWGRPRFWRPDFWMQNDDDERTPTLLMVAVKRNKYDMVRLLIKCVPFYLVRGYIDVETEQFGKIKMESAFDIAEKNDKIWKFLDDKRKNAY